MADVVHNITITQKLRALCMPKPMAVCVAKKLVDIEPPKKRTKGTASTLQRLGQDSVKSGFVYCCQRPNLAYTALQAIRFRGLHVGRFVVSVGHLRADGAAMGLCMGASRCRRTLLPFGNGSPPDPSSDWAPAGSISCCSSEGGEEEHVLQPHSRSDSGAGSPPPVSPHDP